MAPRNAAYVLDDYLVAQCQAGDSAAFSRLFGRWRLRLVRHALAYTHDIDAAHDVAQESWIAIARSIARLDDPSRFRAWSYRIAANKARDWIRRERARRRAAERAAEENGVATVPPESDEAAAAEGEEERDLACLRSHLQTLSPRRRRILHCFYLEGMSVRDVAVALKIPEGTVKSRLFHARRALKASLDSDPDEAE